MKIIISHVYSYENKGDAALLSVLLSDIRRAFDNPVITILTLDPVIEGETFEGAQVTNAFMYYARDHYRNPLLKILYAFFVLTSTLVSALVYRVSGKNIPLPKELRQVVDLYQSADLVLPVGGGYIRSKAGFMNTIRLFFILHPLLFAWIIGKPTINYTQSIGPFGTRFQEFVSKYTVKKLSGVVVREEISMRLLKKWGISNNTHLSVDSGFSFVSKSDKDIRKELDIPLHKMLIGITVRSWLDVEKQSRYESVIGQLCDYIISTHGAQILFIPQVTAVHHADDDRESSKRTYERIVQKKNVHVITQRYDHHTIKAIYGSLDYLIGTRFHSVIFALTAHVPSIAIEYEYKTRGIMADLGLEEWVVGIEDVELTQLKNAFDTLILKKDNYLTHIKNTLPPYIERSKNTIYTVKNIYESII